MKKIPKRLTSIRRGIRYQDLIAAKAILDMLVQTESPPLGVSLENVAGGTFDDVVVRYPALVVWQQVKWASSPVSDPWSLDSFGSPSRGRKTPLIKSFAESWLRIRARGLEFRLELISNRTADAEFQTFLNGRTSKVQSNLNVTQRARIRSAWYIASGLDAKAFQQFLKCLHFRIGLSDIEERRETVDLQLRTLGLTGDSLNRLLARIDQWASDDTTDEIRRQDIVEALGIDWHGPDNRFALPSPRIDRIEIHEELSRRLSSANNGYFAVLGTPGSGKSTTLNLFSAPFEICINPNLRILPRPAKLRAWMRAVMEGRPSLRAWHLEASL